MYSGLGAWGGKHLELNRVNRVNRGCGYLRGLCEGFFSSGSPCCYDGKRALLLR